jgi:hypothetical protein
VLEDSYHIVTLDRQRHVVMERTSRFAADVRRRIHEQTSAAAMRRTLPVTPIRAESASSAA